MTSFFLQTVSYDAQLSNISLSLIPAALKELCTTGKAMVHRWRFAAECTTHTTGEAEMVSSNSFSLFRLHMSHCEQFKLHNSEICNLQILEQTHTHTHSHKYALMHSCTRAHTHTQSGTHTQMFLYHSQKCLA